MIGQVQDRKFGFCEMSHSGTGHTTVFTAKKTLLANNVKEPILDYPSIQPGHVSAGFISKVEDASLILTFYNNVYGRVSLRSLAAELGVGDVKMNYSVWDVLLARVVGCEQRRNWHVSPNNDNGEEYYYQLRLSLKTVLEEKKAEEEDETVPLSTVELSFNGDWPR